MSQRRCAFHRKTARVTTPPPPTPHLDQSPLSDVTTVRASLRTMAQGRSCAKYAYLHSAAPRINTHTHTCARKHTVSFSFFSSKYGNLALCCCVNKQSVSVFLKMYLNSKVPHAAKKREQQTVNELLLSATCSSPPLEGN